MFCLSGPTFILIALLYALILPGQAPTALPHNAAAVRLPALSNDRLLATELAARQPGRPPHFAVSRPLDASPENAGHWRTTGEEAHWTFRLTSPGAKSINLGFSEFHLPDGATLHLRTRKNRFGPLTPADNDAHDTYYSPLLRGDEVWLELRLPAAARPELRLKVATLNHDFVGAHDLIAAATDTCNIDVACDTDDGYPWIDNYRDVIRSVGMYTLNGVSTCTGFLLNNTDRDGRPLFMTAEHCNVTADNAASLVVYWNYQRDECRDRNAPENDLNEDDYPLTFNSGATLLAEYEDSDFTLLELDELVHPDADAYFAGWSALPELPTGELVSVHHPGTFEKRISRSLQPLHLSGPTGLDTLPDGNYIYIPYWDEGTTAGGSSGAPLFDRRGLARGQLTGGTAGCSDPDGYDLYGFLAKSYSGGGTPRSRLRDWLDPCAGGVMELEGVGQDVLLYSLATRQRCTPYCLGEALGFRIRVGRGFGAGSTLRVLGDEADNWQLPTRTTGGAFFTVSRRPDAPAQTAGSYTLRILIEDAASERSDTATLDYALTDELPPRPGRLFPAGDIAGVDPFAVLRWEEAATAPAYELQLSTDPDFSSYRLSIADYRGTELRLQTPLEGATPYYWHVRAVASCGAGPWSEVASFVTGAISCLRQPAGGADVPIGEDTAVTVVRELTVTEDIEIAELELTVGIQHTFIGDLEADLISPAGTVIDLFNPINGGACAAPNVYVTFTDEAGFSADDFARYCEDGSPDEYLAVQPLTPLRTLVGESTRGTWQLVVRDGASGDGGAVVDFVLEVCAAGAGASDLGIEVVDGDFNLCSDEAATAQLRLGSGFGAGTDLRVEAGDLPLDNYTFDFDAETGLLTVDFSAWTLVGEGTFPLSFIAITPDGRDRRAATVLTVSTLPPAIITLTEEIADDLLVASWEVSEVVDDYRVEVSTQQNFGTVLLDTIVAGNVLVLPTAALPPDSLYWRVAITNECGESVSEVRLVGSPNSLFTRPPVRPQWEVTVYPNPSRGWVALTPRGLTEGQRLEAQLYTQTGQPVGRWTGITTGGQQLELGHLPSGVYMLRIVGPWGELSRRIILTE